MIKVTIDDLSTAYRYLYPRHTILITSGTLENPSALAIAWSTPLSADPPLIGFSITKKRYSYDIIKASAEFVINIPEFNQIDETYYVGSVSGFEEPDKIEKAGFNLEASSHIKAPRIAECKINLECKLKDILKTGDHELFIGQVINIAIDPTIMDSFSVNLNEFRPIYWRRSKNKDDTFQLKRKN